MKQLTIILVTLLSWHNANSKTIQSCDSRVYCQGQLLDVVQNATIYKDSKTFVDMAQINSSNKTLDNFKQFMKINANKPTKSQVKQFVMENFKNGDELEKWTPSDFKTDPDILKRIQDPMIREFSRTVINIWPSLARKVKSEVSENPDRYSLLPLPNGFIIPGGRFKEIYYWDSYWIVKGLIISEMTTTVRGILENFISLVRKYGFIPNGSRVYYLNRSQPPLLSLMVGLYIDATNDLKWLRSNVDVLEQELEWWLNNRNVTVEKDGEKHVLARFASNSGTPRPESYYEDVQTCSIFRGNAEKQRCYKNLKSGAESGWDFSSRWLFTSDGDIGTNLTNIDTRRIIPVDLNAFLCGSFKEISRFYKLLGNAEKSEKWLEKYLSWEKSVQSLLYNEQDGIWYDYDIRLSKQRKGFYPSNFAPLWTLSYNAVKKNEYGGRAAKYFVSQGLQEYQGGIPTSLLNSGEQWDFPNAWPPLQEIVILGLLNTGNQDAKNIANIAARRWIAANLRGYNSSGEMFEKYDAVVPGGYGGGGEYIVQSGFGWTNGVVLSLIQIFYTEAKIEQLF